MTRVWGNLSASLARVVGVAVMVAWCAVHAAQAQGTPSYVGSERCTACHEDAAASWRGSHHDLAWTEPDPATVLGDFDNAEFAHDGMEVQFRTIDGTLQIRVTEKTGETTDYPVHSVAGVAPLQQYLLETAPGRLQSFDVVWDDVDKRWYHLYPDQDLPPGDGLHWTGPYKTWNARCAECHATGYQRNYGPQSRSYASTQAEIGVGCEACHGPGSAHLDWAEGRPASLPGLTETGLTIALGDENGTEDDIQLCATCHSRREALLDGNPVPGTPFHDAHTLSLLRPGLYHADGQILEEVYVYGSFLQSKMAARGVGCMNCHDAHSARLKAEGNAVCTQCHSPAGNPDFPTLRLAEYDASSHHFHPEGSDGAACKSCHMIERVYMGIDGRRDHSFRVPRPDLAEETGSPDACTDCHEDRDAAWAAREIEARFPESQHRGPHYGTVLAAARLDPTRVAGDLADLAENKDQPGIVRATALETLQGRADAALADRLAPLLADPDPLVRAAAAGVQRSLPASARAARLQPLLSDPMQSVRIAAARSMIDVMSGDITPSQSALLREAMGEWQKSLSNKLDFPETHLVLGGMALTFRNFEAARGAFREVVRLDPQRAEAWTMLVRLSAAIEGPRAGAQVLDEALRKLPDDPQLRQMATELGR